MTTLTSAHIASLRLPLEDVEQLFRLRQKQQELGDLSQFSQDWLTELQKRHLPTKPDPGENKIPALNDVKQLVRQLQSSDEASWRKLPLNDGHWQAAPPGLIDDYLRQSLSACAARIKEGNDRLIIAPLLALDILAIQPLSCGSQVIASHLALTLLFHTLPALKYLPYQQRLRDYQHHFNTAFRESRENWPEANVLPWLRCWWKFLLDALKEFSAETHENGIGTKRGSRRALVEFYVASQYEPFSLQTICSALPTVSRDMIRLVLAEMRQQERVKCEGRGRIAMWKKLSR
jgi:hypothetical protein